MRRVQFVKRHSINDQRDQRDQGSALILALVLIMVGTMMVLPVMDYTMSVTRANRTTSQVADRTEAVKAGLRVALYDTVALYQACNPTKSGPNVSVDLAVPPGLGIKTWCNSTGTASQNLPDEQRWALVTTQAGSNAYIPPAHSGETARLELNGTISPAWCTSMSPPDNDPYKKTPCGKPYPTNGDADTVAWQANSSELTATDTIFWPSLPPVSNNLSYAGGYPMPVGSDGPCTVYFPGKYTDDVIITGATPVYFVSGIYYFEKGLRVSGNADIVVGSGSVPGCVESDAVAVADAIGAPFDAHSSGVGGTFVFGAAGRLVIDTATAGATGASLKMNRRLVEKSDPLAKLNDVSIMSVTGVFDDITKITSPLSRPGELDVPVARVFNGTTYDLNPWVHKYKASTLVSTLSPPAPCAAPPVVPAATCPIIDINFNTTAKVTLKIPGYVQIAQGSLSLNVTPGSGVNKDLSFGGGIVAAQMYVPGQAPASLQMGLLNPVVQLKLKITTETIAVAPRVTSVAQVQVNETGGYAVNSWVVQANCGADC